MEIKTILKTALAVIVGLVVYNLAVKKLLKIDSYEYNYEAE